MLRFIAEYILCYATISSVCFAYHVYQYKLCLQERIARAHGSQCGFCTPGFVMSMYTLLRSNPAPSEEDVEAAFEGETCIYQWFIVWFTHTCIDSQPSNTGS